MDYLAVGTARRPNRLIDGLFYLKIKDSQYGLLEWLKNPDTTMFNSGEEESYEAEGVDYYFILKIYAGMNFRHKN